MEKLIHLTDTHLVAPPRRLYGLDPLERFRPAIDVINRDHADAVGVFITGDLTHFGEEGAFQALRAELERLTVPYYLLIGNHDVRATLHSVFPELPQDDNGQLQYEVAIESGVCLLMDSVVDGSTAGAYDEDRLEWLKEKLAVHANNDVFLFLHHPPFDIGIPGMDQLRLLEGDDSLARVLRRHERIRHLFFGHVHRPVAGSWNGISVSSLFGTNHQIALTLNETEGVFGTREQPQMGVVLIGENSVIVHMQSYSDKTDDYCLDSPEAEAAQSLESLPRR